MARSGGFSPSLDPFGTSRGGLGRYNVTGDTISSLAETEAYAIAVAWANGNATDAEYIASLQKLKDLTTPGSRDFVTADNRLSDAVYTIGRNAIVKDVNNATTPESRIAALERMQSYDAAHLATMTSASSQAYREQQDRVAGAAVDIRQAKYSALVEKVNRGHASTADLLQLAERLQSQAGNGPDADEWDSTVASLHDRIADEKISDGFQAYQHNRKSGASLLADIDRRMGQLDPGSPAYKALANQREDLAQRVKDENGNIAEAKMQGQRAAGKVSDAKYLSYLKNQYHDATPGTTEAINAGNRLHDFTFSLAEDKLRFDVAHNKRPIGDLVRFYKTYQRGMSPGSERWRQLQTAIDSLGRRGGSGGSSSGKGKGISLGPKIIGGQAAIADFLGSKKAPPGFGDLLRIDVKSVASRHWFDNNLRSMVDAFQDGRGSWTYYDKRGNAYTMPFVPSLMQEMDQLNLSYMHRGLAGAKNAKEAQTWIGRIITATKAGMARNATYTMDVYTKTFASIERAKQQALAGGRYGEYSNLVREQLQLTRFILGTPDGQPADSSTSTNPYLTSDQKGRIMADLGKLAPQNLDQSSPFYNPTGDAVLGLIQSGAISTQADPVTGDILNAQLDPSRGYVTQNSDGTIALVTLDRALHPEDFRPDPVTGDEVPRYRDDSLQVTIRLNGEDVQVWQPVKPPDKTNDSGSLIYVIDPGQRMNLGDSLRANDTLGPRPASYRPIIDPSTGQTAKLSLYTTYTVEHGKSIKWISTDGNTWLRYADDSTVSPRLVMDPSVTIGPDGKWMKDGKEVDPATLAGSTHVWGGIDAVNAGATYDDKWGVGAPGASFATRVRDHNGELDFRPQAVIDSEEQALIHRMRTHADATGPVQRDTPGYGDERPITPRTFRDTPGSGDERPTHVLSDITKFAGELLPPFLRSAVTAVSKLKLPPISGGLSLEDRDLGIKPTPSPMLKPPPVATLAPLTPVNVAGKKGLAPLKPLPKLAPLPKKPPAPKPTGGAPGAYRPPPPPPKPLTLVQQTQSQRER